MRKKLPLLLGATFLAFSAMACEGPTGPRGPEGPAGDDGAPGAPGEPGQNALNTCSDCHASDATIVAIEQQFELSPHGFGNFEVRGPDYSGGACAACHTSQGFVAAATGEVANWDGGVASMNCRTCHQIHTTFTDADYDPVWTDPVEIALTGETIDFGSAWANTCSACHQGRIRDPWPTQTTDVTATFAITSGHFGPHYSTQANVTSTEIGFLFGSATNEGFFGPHADLGCNGCHMASDGFTPTPGGMGGHNWQPAPSTCNTCHTGGDVDSNFNYRGTPQATYDVLYEVAYCLQNTGIITIEGTPPPPSGTALVHGGSVFDYHPNTGTYAEPLVAAFITWAALVEDGSWGVHQPSYASDQSAGLLSFLQTNYPVACPAL